MRRPEGGPSAVAKDGRCHRRPEETAHKTIARRVMVMDNSHGATCALETIRTNVVEVNRNAGQSGSTRRAISSMRVHPFLISGSNQSWTNVNGCSRATAMNRAE